MNRFKINWDEDGDATVLGRITARNGTGAATGVDGEGKFLKQADITEIERKTFDLDGASPATPTDTTILVIATVVLDTPVTDKEIWTLDDTGYNLLDDVAAALFPDGGNRYNLEYKITLTGGAVMHGSYEGLAKKIDGS